MVEINFLKLSGNKSIDKNKVSNNEKLIWQNLILMRMNRNDEWIRFEFLKNIQLLVILITLTPILISILSFTLSEIF